ncbi:unnamed protein product [Paramecium primaurelia]|uniref:B30.2/SPRY domain-containing protein n=1 Tax=Paramecium primaurelia TaxID=5886 RepID=A0A8S1M9B3_PARPR|nr:unnamed protein product [Paramecium primaurelia]
MESCQNEKHIGNLLFGYCSKMNCNSNLKTFCDICRCYHDEHLQDLHQLDSLDDIKLKNIEYNCQLLNFFENQKRFCLEIQTPLMLINYNNNLKIDYQNKEVLIDQIKQIVTIQSILNAVLPMFQNINKSCNQIIQEFNKLQQFNYNLDIKKQEIKEKKNILKKQKIVRKQDQKSKLLSEKQNITEIIQWQNLQIHFSQKFKYKYIKILNNGLIAQNEDDRGMVICEPMLPKKGQYRFAFGINDNAYLIWIGICHKEYLIQNNYKTNFSIQSDNKNGVYLINNYGVTNSHLNPDLNDQTNSFFFELDDLIIVYVDMDIGYIKWESKKSNNQYSMQFDTSQDVYPCAGITAFSPIFIVQEF